MKVKHFTAQVLVILMLVIAFVSSVGCLCYIPCLFIKGVNCDFFEWILVLIPNLGFWTGIKSKSHILWRIVEWGDL